MTKLSLSCKNLPGDRPLSEGCHPALLQEQAPVAKFTSNFHFPQTREGPTRPPSRGGLPSSPCPSFQKFPKTPALLQPPPGSSCQDILLLFAPLLACRIAKGGGTSFLVPFNLLPTSYIAFYQLSPFPSRSVCSSKLHPESFQCSPVLSPVCPGSLCVHQSLS